MIPDLDIHDDTTPICNTPYWDKVMGWITNEQETTGGKE
jgi:hypothetical protein